MMPIPAETPKETKIALIEGVDSNPIKLPVSGVNIQPITMPAIPPRELVTPASMTNCCKMVRRFAPRDLRMPIYRVRSVTDTSMMFMIPMPATNREIAAIPTNSIVIISVMEVTISNISERLVTLYRSSFMKIP